jgi:hypothetical protein
MAGMHHTPALPFGETAAAAEALARARSRKIPGAPPPGELSDLPSHDRPPAAPPSATAALEVFDQLAKDFFAATGLWPPNHALAPKDDVRAAERAERWAMWLRDRRRTEAAPAPEPAREPAPNSPEDAGYLSPEQRSAARPATPSVCRDCSQPIVWGQLLAQDERGAWARQPRADGKGWKAIPVDSQPNPDGRVLLFRRKGEGIVARQLRAGETPPPGATLRTSHWTTCTARKRR